MQNSLDRLLRGIAETLTEHVEPAVADPWVASQVAAAAELLTTLSPRVSWDVHGVMPWVPACRAAIVQAVARDDAPDGLPASRAALALPDLDAIDASAAGTEAYLQAHLRALSELASWSISATGTPPELRDAIRRVIDAQAANERELLRATARSARDAPTDA